jgi:hypothetical protein
MKLILPANRQKLNIIPFIQSKCCSSSKLISHPIHEQRATAAVAAVKKTIQWVLLFAKPSVLVIVGTKDELTIHQNIIHTLFNGIKFFFY